MGRPARHHGNARGLNRHAQVFDPGAGFIQVAQIGKRTLSLQHATTRCHRLILVAFDGQPKAFQTPLGQIAVCFCTAQRAARIGDRAIRVTTRLACAFVGLGLLGQSACQAVMGIACALCPLAGLFK